MDFFAKIYINATKRDKLPSTELLQIVWNEWLWKNDCNADLEEVYGDMNSMHIIGILLALLESMNPTDDVLLVQSLLPNIPLVHLHKKPIAQYTLRELTNQVECLQLSWGQVLSHGDFDSCFDLLKRLFARFGYIIHHAYMKAEDSVLDDPQYMTPIPSSDDNEVLFITTRKYIRQMICIFFSLFRAIYIISSAEVVSEISEEREVLIKTVFKTHHIESSMDFFNNLQQVICLAPGMRLVYRTNFSGMYNDISQVVYFHHPKFSKQPQLKLSEILQCSLNTLPLMTQVFPQITVCYEDDSFIPFLSEGCLQNNDEDKKMKDMNIDEFVRTKMEQEEIIEKLSEKDNEEKRFTWLVCCSSVFLIDSKKEKIFTSYNTSLLPLVSHVINSSETQSTKDLFQSDEESSLLSFNDKNIKMDLGTAYGHVCLL